MAELMKAPVRGVGQTSILLRAIMCEGTAKQRIKVYLRCSQAMPEHAKQGLSHYLWVPFGTILERHKVCSQAAYQNRQIISADLSETCMQELVVLQRHYAAMKFTEIHKM